MAPFDFPNPKSWQLRWLQSCSPPIPSLVAFDAARPDPTVDPRQPGRARPCRPERHRSAAPNTADHGKPWHIRPRHSENQLQSQDVFFSADRLPKCCSSLVILTLGFPLVKFQRPNRKAPNVQVQRIGQLSKKHTVLLTRRLNSQIAPGPPPKNLSSDGLSIFAELFCDPKVVQKKKRKLLLVICY